MGGDGPGLAPSLKQAAYAAQRQAWREAVAATPPYLHPQGPLSMVSIAWEPIDKLLRDGLEDLAVLHWEESEIDKEEIPLEIDVDRARAFEKASQYRIAGLRREGELIGYAAFVSHHLDLPSSNSACVL